MTAALQRFEAAPWRLHVRGLRRFRVPTLDAELAARIERAFGEALGAEAAVQRIVDDVAERGDAALADWTSRLDGVTVPQLRADPAAMEAAWHGLDADLRRALSIAADRIRRFHALQVPTAALGDPDLCLRPMPMRRAGCYVPGGRAAYPSTVLMSVIPAQAAGVEHIAVATPPGPDGAAHPAVLAAAHLLGAPVVYAMGGAQAVAAMAYGTETVEPVDIIVGPGNLFVTLAKRAVFGTVGIDGLAGPSEILIVASRGADPRLVAIDLISQLEHDPLAWAVCVTDDPALAGDVEAAFSELAASAVRRGVIDAAAGRHGMVVVCSGMDEALELADLFAPEHLELQGDAAEALAGRVRTAGAVFVGSDSPVPMGDYIAGPNHTLPTGGAARFGGPLSALTFTRWPSITRLDSEDIRVLGPVACTLATAEGLLGHADSIRMRMPEQA